MTTSVPRTNPAFKGLRVGVLRDALEHSGVDSEYPTVCRSGNSMSIAMQELRLSTWGLEHSRYAVPTYYVVAPCVKRAATYLATTAAITVIDQAKAKRASRWCRCIARVAAEGFGR